MTGHEHTPDCDPITAAGSLHCCACGELSYPLTAAWLTATLILVTFDQQHERGCPHRTACGTVLLNADAAGPDIPFIDRPRFCRGTTTAGRPCRATPPAGSGFCRWHDPARQVA